MNNAFTNALDCLKNTQISKHYDCETKLLCGKCEGEPLSMRLKGDLTVNAVQIIAVCAVASVMCVSFAIARKLKS